MRDDHLYRVLDKDTWMIDIIRAIRKMPLDHLDKNSQKKIISESKKYFWDAPYLFKLGNDGVMRRCVPREERLEILRKWHSAEYGGHYSHFRTQAKVWSSGFSWPEMHEDCLMPRMPKNWKHLSKKFYAFEIQSTNRFIRCVGYRLHGAFQKLSWI
jgi:hypothetical protein